MEWQRAGARPIKDPGQTGSLCRLADILIKEPFTLKGCREAHQLVAVVVG